ncbi:hypothetical protein Dda_9085 [Drechslerella dactyloides]|uniref:UvrD-like helicase ATP-binding domain-containing protein n=1 Tax=Drechslerella dactyloides TaxID=74499 RepID=A0AAD6IPX5_DREDA|nr:hypothetical protein Dda_9085 [Drechslerella dactyloides]
MLRQNPARAFHTISGSKLKKTQSDITVLPSETLLNIAGYLSNKDVAAFAEVFPFMDKLVGKGPFHRWQGLLGEFNIAQDAAFEAIERDRLARERTKQPVAAASLVSEIPEVRKLEKVTLPYVVSNMGISIAENTQIQLNDIFVGLANLGSAPFAPLVEGGDAHECSNRLRSSLSSMSPIGSLTALLPDSVSRRLSELQPSVFDRILVTVYLIFTKLRPEDLTSLLPKHSTLGYINEQGLAEYLSYILLFLKIFKLDNARWEDVLHSTDDDEAPLRTRWNYSNGSPLSGYSVQILQQRIERWFTIYHETRDFAFNSRNPVLTSQQRRFVQTDIRKGEIFKVRAFAGTGKTKCLVDYAKRRPRERMLYVAYNRQAKMDADFRFKDCANVDCKTLHSVAFNALSIVNPTVDRQVKGKPAASVQISAESSRRGTFSRISSAPADNNFLRSWEIESVVNTLDLTLEKVEKVFTTPYDWKDDSLERMGIGINDKAVIGSARNTKNPENLARIVTTGIDRFCQSKDTEPNLSHFSLAQCRTKLCNPEQALWWLKSFWNKIMNGESPLMTHDCYLKMFSLTTNANADIYTFGKYNVVMFDEAQDANPCMANIILRQREAAAIIIIGDPYQMIYGFRGARNECFDDDKLPPDRTFHLTNSFRFGQDVADVANLILGTIGERKLLRGIRSDAPSPALFLPPRLSSRTGIISPLPRHTVIFRTNTELVKYFFATFTRDPNKPICLRTSAANASTAIIPLLKAGYYLYKGSVPKHPRLRGIISFNDAKAYLQREDRSGGLDTDDVDIQAIALVVGMERYYAEDQQMGTSFLEMLESSAGCIVDIEDHADLVLTTAHQSKGLEWDDVIIADDFITTGLTVTNATDQWCDYIHAINEELSIDTDTTIDTCPYFSSKPSPCVGFEILVPRRDPSAADGWIEYTRKSSNPIEIPKCVYTPSIACLNCILAWRSVDHNTHGDLFRFAEGIRGRYGSSKSSYHSKFKLFWAGRFPPNMVGQLLNHRLRRSLTEVYSTRLRMGLEKPQIIGGIKESEDVWSITIFKMAGEAGIEYDDDDVEDYIKAYDDNDDEDF